MKKAAWFTLGVAGAIALAYAARPKKADDPDPDRFREASNYWANTTPAPPRPERSRRHLGRRLAVTVAALALLVAGIGGGAYAASALSTGTVSVCATATAPTHTVKVDTTGVATVGGDTAAKCATTTFTIPTVTQTGSTTAPTTTTSTTTTTTTSPPPVAGVKGYYDQGADNVADWNAYKQYGFNLVFAPIDTTLLKQVKADGGSAWVQPNIWQGCSYRYSTAQALTYAQQAVATGAVSGFYVADEPSRSGCSTAPSQIAAWTATLHQNFPGIPTVISEWNASDLAAFASAADEFALDVYPCQYGSCNYSTITNLAAAADKLGVKYVGVPQAFGGDSAGHYDLPTASQEQQILTTWKATNELGWVVYAFSASGMPSSTWLQNHPELLSVIASN